MGEKPARHRRTLGEQSKYNDRKEQYPGVILVYCTGRRARIKYRVKQHNPAHLGVGLVDEDNFSAVTKGERRCGLFGGGDVFLL